MLTNGSRWPLICVTWVAISTLDHIYIILSGVVLKFCMEIT